MAAKTKKADAPKPGGRPLKLTPEMEEAIVANVAGGNFYEASAEAAGLPTSTFYRYMEVGSDVAKARAVCEEEGREWKPATPNDQRLLEFWEAVTRARAAAQVDAVKLVTKAGEDDWRAAAWYLERAFPKLYGKRLQVPEQEKSEAELTREQSKIVATIMRATVEGCGLDPDNPEVKAMMRDALEKAAASG